MNFLGFFPAVPINFRSAGLLPYRSFKGSLVRLFGNNSDQNLYLGSKKLPCEFKVNYEACFFFFAIWYFKSGSA